MGVKKDWTQYVGERFGKLVVKEFLGKRGKQKVPFYLCECDCGNEVEKTIRYLQRDRNKKSRNVLWL